ncbi:MAG TPA: pyroglutamyl-peptidase I [Blastocatellia bacterium]|nr:pyroglutamyl-peptidase I [Blastocatellia bacterium]
MKRLLLTAFEPFGGESLNSSLQAARRIAEMSFRDALVQVLELPVDRHLAVERALEALREHSPDVVVMLGEAGGRYRVNPERVAVNIDDFRIPDNAGNKPSDEPVVEGGPAAYFSTLPIRAITERLIEARIPAAISNSAGTFLCNRLFYSVMYAIASEGRATKAGFIHLPYLHEQTIPKQVDQPGLSLESIVEAVRLAIEVSLE